MTPLQMVAAYAAIANGGRLMRPYVVRRITAPDGDVVLEHRAAGRAAAPERARGKDDHRSPAARGRGEGGTGGRARLDEFTVAGKTGTAQKVDPRTRAYSSKRIGSFVGFVPADHPRAVILVLIDEPTTSSYGGVVAAPVFRNIAESVMQAMRVAPERQAPDPGGKGPKVQLARAGKQAKDPKQAKPSPRPRRRSCPRPRSSPFRRRPSPWTRTGRPAISASRCARHSRGRMPVDGPSPCAAAAGSPRSTPIPGHRSDRIVAWRSSSARKGRSRSPDASERAARRLRSRHGRRLRRRRRASRDVGFAPGHARRCVRGAFAATSTTAGVTSRTRSRAAPSWW